MMKRITKVILPVLATAMLSSACTLMASDPAQSQSLPATAYNAHPDWAILVAGKITCADGKSYTIVRAETGKHMAINWQGRQYDLYHIPTSSGSYRYEDATSGLVIVHIPDKALLLNSKIGQRLADECRSR